MHKQHGCFDLARRAALAQMQAKAGLLGLRKSMGACERRAVQEPLHPY
jgi:hypothetical protein